MSRRYVLAIALIAAMAISGSGRGAAQAPVSLVTATAECFAVSGNTDPSVRVAIENRAGQAIVISYVHGFTIDADGLPRFLLREPAPFATELLAKGASMELTAPWDDLRRDPADTGAVLIVTNLGVLAPGCAGEPASLVPTPHNSELSTSRAMDAETAAAIAMETYGLLQSWFAYPALYAQLHPDSRAAVAWGTFACLNAAEHGTADDPALRVRGTEVATVHAEPFAYGVTGQKYPEALRVNYRQTLESGHVTGNGIDFVMSNGQYRPFFGNDPGYLAQLPATCDALAR